MELVLAVTTLSSRRSLSGPSTDCPHLQTHPQQVDHQTKVRCLSPLYTLGTGPRQKIVGAALILVGYLDDTAGLRYQVLAGLRPVAQNLLLLGFVVATVGMWVLAIVTLGATLIAGSPLSLCSWGCCWESLGHWWDTRSPAREGSEPSWSHGCGKRTGGRKPRECARGGRAAVACGVMESGDALVGNGGDRATSRA